MAHAFMAKLQSANGGAGLSDSDRDALSSLCSDVREFDAKDDVILEGDRPDHVNLMIDGWACRYKVLLDGSRQITAFLLPGDFCDAHITLFPRMDHSIAALTPCRVAFVSAARMHELTERPAIARALWWASLVDEAVLRAWIVNLGRRDAFDRVGHLICELHARLCNVGLTNRGEFELPLRQEEIADALGLTAIHVNRTLRRLREHGLINRRQRRLVTLDIDRLQDVVGFEANYLHLPGETAKQAAVPRAGGLEVHSGR